MKIRSILALSASTLLVMGACKKDKEETTLLPVNNTIAAKVLADFSTNIAIANLEDLNSKASELDVAVNAFVNSPSDASLQTAQQKWYSTRIAWEQSEAFLFGPVATMELDPAIDSWPVNFVDIDSVISGNDTYSESFIDSLNPTLKGFHPIEYLLFGKNGARKFDELSTKEKNYLVALSLHLKTITAKMHHEWVVSGGNYATQVSAAGTSASTEFATQKEAMLEIANGIIGIVDEVGGGKIEDPFVSKDPSQEESPFSKNSWADFKNNIIGVRNVYTGKYSAQGTSMSDWVKLYNKSLDTKIQQRIEAAINNLGAYTTPFGEAILNQPANIQATQTVLNDLKTTMEEELIPLIQQYVQK